jgi:hypothetical protein
MAGDMVVAGCAANIRPICTAIAADTAFDTTAATELGVERARGGVPLSSVMEAYRVGFRRLWDAVVTELTSRPGLELATQSARRPILWRSVDLALLAPVLASIDAVQFVVTDHVQCAALI